MSFPTAVILCLACLPLAWTLQATPNSACASYCIDQSSANASDIASFNTYDSDLTCSDAKYNSTDVGKKFKNCNDCLLNSAAHEADVSDQGALMYNLRATVDLCLWGYPNASSAVSSPCNIDYGCLPLQKALTYGNLDPKNESEWGYCSADNGAFLGENLSPCIQCFQSSTDQQFIANFLIALQAGCQQKPKAGQVVGVEGSLFSKTEVNVTALATPVPTKAPSKGMQTGTVVGIAVGGVLFVVAFITFGVVCLRRRRMHRKGLAELKSDCDDRYGAQDISCPTMGGFAAPPTPKEKDPIPAYDRQAQKLYRGEEEDLSLKHARTASQRSIYTAAWLANPAHEGAIPAHPAYLPKDQVQTPPPPKLTFEPPSRPSTRNTSRPATRNEMRVDNISPKPSPSYGPGISPKASPGISPRPSPNFTLADLPSRPSTRNDIRPATRNGMRTTNMSPGTSPGFSPGISPKPSPGLSPGFSPGISPSIKTTTLIARPDAVVNPSPNTDRSKIYSPGLPATPKARAFVPFGSLWGSSSKAPPLPPKTPNDIFN